MGKDDLTARLQQHREYLVQQAEETDREVIRSRSGAFPLTQIIAIEVRDNYIAAREEFDKLFPELKQETPANCT